MPTNLEYALFSANVYGNTSDVRSPRNTLPYADGWEPIGIKVVLADGFMARAYKKGSEIVISYAGTTDENMLDWITGNGPGGTAAFLAPQISDAAKFYLDISKANPTVTNVSFTGHSLGGGLASLMAVYFDKPAVVFDEAPFQKSADSADVVNALKATLTASGYTLPPSFSSYIALDPTGSFVPSPTRMARDDQVKQIYVKGEVLSLASTTMLNFTAAALGLISPKLWVIGTGVDKVRGSEMEIDPQAKTILDWGTTAWGYTVTSGDPVALHSISLLSAFLQSPSFLGAAQTYPELLPRMFAGIYRNDPKNKIDANLTDLLTQREYRGEGSLGALAVDVMKINHDAGLTSLTDLPGSGGRGLNNVAAIVIDAVLASLYQQGKDRLPTQPYVATFNTLLRPVTGGLTADLRPLDKEADKVEVELNRMVSLLLGDDAAGMPTSRHARWTLQSGTDALSVDLTADARDDVVIGYTGADSIGGGAGDDVLVGLAGTDTMAGGAGMDHLFGGADADTLDGGAGGDYLFGGAGDDTYDLKTGELFDTINDSDGTGRIMVNGIQLTGGKKKADNSWVSDDKVWGYTLMSGGDLIITRGSSTDKIVVQNWRSTGGNKLGLDLQDAPAAPPPVPGVYSYPGHADGDWLGGGDMWGEATFPAGPADDRRYYDRVDYVGLGGNDILFGYSHDDKLDGGAGDDVIYGGLGSDQIQGGAGNDVIMSNINGGHTETNADTWSLLPDLAPGATAWTSGATHRYEVDPDSIGPAFQENWLIKKDAEGRLYMPDFAAFRRGTPHGQATPTPYDPEDPSRGDTVDAGAGDDYVWGGLGADTILGDLGADVLHGLGGADVIEGGDGNDRLYGDVNLRPAIMALWNPDAAVLTYTMDNHPFQKIIDGSVQGADIIDAGAGDDVVQGDGGSDTLYGGTGNDEIWGDDIEANLAGGFHGNDYLDGEDGNDQLVGGGKNDILWGGAGNDTLWGDAAQQDLAGAFHGSDYLDGEDGDDQLIGGGGADTLFGGAGNDLMHGDDTADQLDASFNGDDYLDGEDGDDRMVGGGGNDTLIGGNGSDRLVGGAGADYMEGGAGSDYYEIDNPGDVVVEVDSASAAPLSLAAPKAPGAELALAAGEPDIDTIAASFSYTLGAGFENLVLTGTDAIDGSGNEANNAMLGNSAANVLTGGLGNDSIDGKEGTTGEYVTPAECQTSLRYPLLITGNPMTTTNHQQDSFTQPCRRTRRASVPHRLRARGLGVACTRTNLHQHRDLHANSAASANWLRRCGTATRHACGWGWVGEVQYRAGEVHCMQVMGTKWPNRSMDACTAQSGRDSREAQ